MSPVSPIPEGYHTVTPHLILDDSAAAIEFYKNAFGATERLRMPAPGGGIMHAEIQIGDSILWLADDTDNAAISSPQSLGSSSVTLNLYVEDVDAVFAQAVEAGAKVAMPLSDMFWGDRFAMVTDPFGHNWSLATHTVDLTDEEMEKAMQEAMAQAGPA